jgi:ribose transport system ATP-binding protein
MENISIDYEVEFLRFGLINWKSMAPAARKQLAKVKLDLDPATITSKFSFAQRQIGEQAKVSTLEGRVKGDLVILLDESPSVLAEEEVQRLFKLIHELTSQVSFIFLSHRIDKLMAISGRIYGLKDCAVAVVLVGAALPLRGWSRRGQKSQGACSTLPLEDLDIPRRIAG